MAPCEILLQPIKKVSAVGNLSLCTKPISWPSNLDSYFKGCAVMTTSLEGKNWGKAELNYRFDFFAVIFADWCENQTIFKVPGGIIKTAIGHNTKIYFQEKFQLIKWQQESKSCKFLMRADFKSNVC